MKRCVFILLSLLVLLSGCDKNDDVARPRVISAESLSDELTLLVEKYGNSKFVPKKDDFRLSISTKEDTKAYQPTYYVGSEEWRAYNEWAYSFIDNGLLTAYQESVTKSTFTYAGISDGARIYADKILWGRDAGEDLGDMFAIAFYFNDIIATYPEFYVLYGPFDKHPETFRELTSSRIALNSIGGCVAYLKFAETPPEVLNTVTFTVEIPIDVKYYTDYPPEMYEQHPNLKPEGRRLLKGSTTVKFDTSATTP